MIKTNHPFSRSIDGLINEIFNEWPANVGKVMREDVLGHPPVNITEQKDAYVIELNAAGYEKADFNIKLEANQLVIQAEKKERKFEEGSKLIRTEFSQKGFKRSFTVDEKIKADGILARYENGILFVTLPKKEVNEQVKDITVQ